MSPTRRRISVGALARVEGEGGIVIDVQDGSVRDVRLKIYEPPRLFEALLVGRRFDEPPDLTARICGICPVAYQMSACLAVENACGVTVDPPLADLRRLLYCGEWISSHSLHIYMLHAPDFLGFDGIVDLAGVYPEQARVGLELKRLGNQIMTVLGGRAIHPVNVRLGGFYRLPQQSALQRLAEQIKYGRDLALGTLRWVGGFDFPDFEPPQHWVAMSDGVRYPIMEGEMVSSAGLRVPAAGFEDEFAEEQVAHSTALHSRTRNGGHYLTGPVARFNLNFPLLPPAIRDAAAEVGLGPTCTNPFMSIVVRALEVLYACDEALRLIEGYEPPDRPFVPVAPVPATGRAFTEAPRGTLYHRYGIGDDGLITSARIVPPTSQNQGQIEDDLRLLVQDRLELDQDRLTDLCERAVRNYDPCISCATHVITLDANHL